MDTSKTSERYESYVHRDNGIVYVSTCESEGGSLPMGVTESPWVGETCAWDFDPAAPASQKRGRMVFGPDYHHGELMERHIESIRAVMAGHAYISDHREALDGEQESDESTALSRHGAGHGDPKNTTTNSDEVEA